VYGTFAVQQLKETTVFLNYADLRRDFDIRL